MSAKGGPDVGAVAEDARHLLRPGTLQFSFHRALGKDERRIRLLPDCSGIIVLLYSRILDFVYLSTDA